MSNNNKNQLRAVKHVESEYRCAEYAHYERVRIARDRTEREIQRGYKIIEDAIKAGKLEPELNSGSPRDWKVRAYTLYDVRGGEVLVKRRYGYGSYRERRGSRKYWEQEYFTIKRNGRGFIIENADGWKNLVIKRARGCARPGDLLDVLEDKARLLPNTGARGPVQKWKALKAVALVNGKYVSVYDSSEYEIGKTRVEAVEGDHGGGFYVYHDMKDLLTALESKAVWGNLRNHPDQLVILECEVWGRCAYYDKGKYAYSFIKPLRVVQGPAANDSSAQAAA